MARAAWGAAPGQLVTIKPKFTLTLTILLHQTRVYSYSYISMYISVDILQFCTSHHQTRVYSYSYNSPAFLHSDLQNRVTRLHSRHFSYSVYIIQCCTSHLVTIKPLHNAYKWPIAVHSGHQTIQFALQTFSYELPVCLCTDLEPIKPVLTVQRVQTLLQPLQCIALICKSLLSSSSLLIK